MFNFAVNISAVNISYSIFPFYCDGDADKGDILAPSNDNERI